MRCATQRSRSSSREIVDHYTRVLRTSCPSHILAMQPRPNFQIFKSPKRLPSFTSPSVFLTPKNARCSLSLSPFISVPPTPLQSPKHPPSISQPNTPSPPSPSPGPLAPDFHPRNRLETPHPSSPGSPAARTGPYLCSARLDEGVDLRSYVVTRDLCCGRVFGTEIVGGMCSFLVVGIVVVVLGCMRDARVASSRVAESFADGAVSVGMWVASSAFDV